ncbi:MAG: hypothetical protein SGBAC_002288 [Bacillariaceae sp.]
MFQSTEAFVPVNTIATNAPTPRRMNVQPETALTAYKNSKTAASGNKKVSNKKKVVPEDDDEKGGVFSKPANLIFLPFVAIFGLDLVLNILVVVKRSIEVALTGQYTCTALRPRPHDGLKFDTPKRCGGKQVDMTGIKVDVGMDASFSIDVDFENLFVPDLEMKIQDVQVLQDEGFVHCTTDPNKYVIGSANVGAELNPSEACEEDTTGAACFRISVNLDIFVKGEIKGLTVKVTGSIADAFGADEGSIVDLLKLDPPYVDIALVSIASLDPKTRLVQDHQLYQVPL